LIKKLDNNFLFRKMKHKAKEKITDKDFYLENELTVMTKAFHLKRGYCCGSNCRHCPYDHENVVKHKSDPKH